MARVLLSLTLVHVLTPGHTLHWVEVAGEASETGTVIPACDWSTVIFIVLGLVENDEGFISDLNIKNLFQLILFKYFSFEIVRDNHVFFAAHSLIVSKIGF